VRSSLTFAVDAYDIDSFVDVAANFGMTSFAYVVTPNVDHLIRYWDDAQFRLLYAQAGYVLLDSRMLAHILALARRLRVPVCTGSDLTVRLMALIAPSDTVVLVGGSERQAGAIAQRYGMRNLRHYDPPMGFIRDPAAVEAVLRFIEAHSPFRFCFLCVGSPQQEVLACALKQRGIARGLALCVGASVNFLTGAEQRAPRWLQWLGLEWSYRLMRNPRRLAWRYLIRGPRIFGLLPHLQLQLRQPSQLQATEDPLRN
jgi:exopolysaccharide biosynthesis WecB/TagA/CpsF family protein